MTEETKAPIDYSAAIAAAAEADNLTEQNAGGGGEFPIPEAGPCTLRLKSYLELGVATGKPTAKVKVPKPQLKCRLTFEINSPVHMIERDDGTKIPNQINIWINRPANGKGLASKSNYAKLFNAMNVTGEYNHFAQMVDKAEWLAEIYHADSGDAAKPYVNLNNEDRIWSFKIPSFTNPVDQTVTKVPVPELHGDPLIFFWENTGITDAMYKEMWDGIYIDGEFENDDGTKKSKNWIQETIAKSESFQGSRLANILLDGAQEAPEQVVAAAEAQPEPTPVHEVGNDVQAATDPSAPVEEPAQESPVAPEYTAQGSAQPVEDVDPLVAMGLA